MKIPRRIKGTIILVGLVGLAVALLGFAHAFSPDVHQRCFSTLRAAQWPKWIGCAMAVHQDLAGGLIGLAGAFFAAWLAYSGAKDQLDQISAEQREAARLRAEASFKEAATEIEALERANRYLTQISKYFPDTNDPGYLTFDFEKRLKELNRRARIYLSQSASIAPFGYGRTITTVIWRMEKFAKSLDERPATNIRDVGSLNDEIRLTVEAVREIDADIGFQMPSLKQRLDNLALQFKNLGGEPKVHGG